MRRNRNTTLTLGRTLGTTLIVGALGLIATPAAADPGTDLVGYDKGFFIKSADGKYKLTINGRVQARFTAELPEGADDEYAFAIQRARVGLKGNVFTQNLTYKFQMDLGKGNVALKDFFIDFRAVKSWLHVRAGQFKKPFSRQQLTSSGSLEFVDRALTDGAFGQGRDIGLLIHNNYEKSPEFEYALGFFNGTGDKASLSGKVAVDTATGAGTIASGKFSNVPDHFRPMVALRVGYNHGGIQGYKEVDFAKKGVRVAIGASLLADLALEADGDEGSLVAEVDYALKVAGFSTTGGFYLRNTFGAAGKLDLLGFHAQAGYLIGTMFQPVVRYARLMPDGADDTQEVQLGFNVYFMKHALSWQTDGTMIGKGSGSTATTDWMARTQVQLAF